MQIAIRWRFIIVALLCLPGLTGLTAVAQEIRTTPTIIYTANHALSIPLSEVPDAAYPPSTPQHPRVLFLGLRPEHIVENPGVDPVAQEPVGPTVRTTNLLNFDGQPDPGFIPPDPNGAVGSTQFVQAVNTTFAIYDKATSALLKGPLDLHGLWSNLPGLCESSPLESDPVVLYDKQAGRWLFSEIAYTIDNASNTVCLAVSTTSDATGTYNLYSISFGGDLPDYPKIATWPDAYYASFNIFTSGGQIFKGPEVCALDRTAMLVGNPMTMQCFQRSTGDFSFLPSDLDGTTPPPVGSPNFFVETLATGSTLLLFAFHIDFINPANTTFYRVGPVSGVASFTKACGGNNACVPQPSPGELLYSLGDRLMFRLGYRNFGSHESLVVNHSVNPGTGPASGVRWYEIRSPRSTPFVHQQGTVTNAKLSYWMGSIAMDKVGDMALGFSASSAGLPPSIVYTGRIPSDPLGTMEKLSLVTKGTGVQVRGSGRWGDYSSMSIDPTDDCTFWYTQEYYKVTGNRWNTRIASFRFNSCK